MANCSARSKPGPGGLLGLALLASLLLHLLGLVGDWPGLALPAAGDSPALQPLSATLRTLAPASQADLSPARSVSPAKGHGATLRVPVQAKAAPAADEDQAAVNDNRAEASAGAESGPVPSPETDPPAAGADAAVATFPAQASVRYEVLYGVLMAGVADLDWKSRDGQYRIVLTLRSLFSPTLRYTSEGTLNAQGLRPLRFEAHRGDTRREHAEFDWASHTLHYGDRDDKTAELEDGAQDILSLIFQLALRAGALEGQTVQMTTGKKVYRQPVSIDGEAAQNLAGHTLATVQVSSEARGDRTDVWLARDQHHLPLRIRRSGDKIIDQRAIRVQLDGVTILERPEPERLPHGH